MFFFTSFVVIIMQFIFITPIKSGLFVNAMDIYSRNHHAHHEYEKELGIRLRKVFFFLTAQYFCTLNISATPRKKNN